LIQVAGDGHLGIGISGFCYSAFGNRGSATSQAFAWVMLSYQVLNLSLLEWIRWRGSKMI
jgi:hypothetical protein